jgi:hypothetical protein
MHPRLVRRNHLYTFATVLLAALVLFANPTLGGEVHRLNTGPSVLSSNPLPGTPTDVDSNSTGMLIAVTEEGKVHVLTATGAVQSTVDLPGNPKAIAVEVTDITAGIYIACDNGSVYRLNGSLSVVNTKSVSGVPVDVTVDPAGIVYVATSGGTIHKLSGALQALSTGSISGPLTAIHATGTGDLYVGTSGGTVRRLNAALAQLNSGSVGGAVTGIASNPVGDVFVSTASGTLVKISPTIQNLKTSSLSGVLVGVDANSAGDVVTANEAGIVYVANTGLTSLNSTSVGSDVSAVTIEGGNIYAVGGEAPNISVSVSNLLMGNVDVENSGSANFQVQHVAGGSLQVTVSSSDPAFSVSPASFTLASGLTTVTVTFNAPATPGFYGATITVEAKVGTESEIETVQVSATAVLQPAQVSVSPANLTFPPTPIVTAQASLPVLSFTIAHVQGGDLTLSVSSSDSAKFEIVGSPPTTLAAGSTATIQVRFKAPSPANTYSGNISVTATNAAGMDTKTVQLLGESLQGISVSTTALNFPPTGIGTPSSSLPTRKVTVTHSGGSSLVVTASIDNTAAFEIAGQASFTLANLGDTLDITVRFKAPAPADPYSGTLTIQSTGSSGTDTKLVSLTGTSFVPTPQACYSVSALTFGSVNTNDTKQMNLVVTSCGTDDLEISQISLTSSDPSVWSFSPVAPPAIKLSPNAQQIITVTLSVPDGLTSDVTYTGSLSVKSNDGVNPQLKVIQLTGTGHVPVAIMEIPAQYHDLDFGEFEVGFELKKPLVVRNNGDLPLTFDIVAVDPSDPDASQFSFEAAIGSYMIGPYSEKTFLQTFAPTSTGMKDVKLRFQNSNDSTFSQLDVLHHGKATSAVPIDAVLLLDRSGSMSQTAGEIVKIEALSRAGKEFARMLRDNVDYLGLTKYDHQNDNILWGRIDTIRPQTDAVMSAINDINGIKPRGTTGIGGAMVKGTTQYAQSPTVTPPDPQHRKVMVVLTDGKENEWPYIQDVLNGYTGYPGIFVQHPKLRIYSIGLGLQSNINASKLQAITNRGPGGFYLVTGNLEGLSLFNLENFYFKIFADSTGQSMVVDPAFWIRYEESRKISIPLTSRDRGALCYFLGELPLAAYEVELIDPEGHRIYSSGLTGGIMVDVVDGPNSRLFRLLPAATSRLGALAGNWTLRATVLDFPNVQKVVAAANLSLVEKLGEERPHRVSLAASAASNVRLSPWSGPGMILPGEPLLLDARLEDAGWPTTGGHVSVVVENPEGKKDSIELLDDGTGVYRARYTDTNVAGVYTLHYSARGQAYTGEMVTRVSTRSHFVGSPEKDPVDRPEPPPRDTLCCLVLLMAVALMLVLQACCLFILLRRRP